MGDFSLWASPAPVLKNVQVPQCMLFVVFVHGLFLVHLNCLYITPRLLLIFSVYLSQEEIPKDWAEGGGAKKWQERLTVRLVYPDSHLKLECWNKLQYWARGCRFKSQPFSFQVTMSCKMFVNKKCNLVAVMGQWCHAAGKVIIGHCVLCVSQTSVVYPPIRARGLRKGDEHPPTLLVCVTLYLAFFEVAG